MDNLLLEMEGGKPREHEHVPPFVCFAEMEESKKMCYLWIKDERIQSGPRSILNR